MNRQTGNTAVDVQRPETWQRYRKGLCAGCRAGCCSLPVEARMADLLRMGLVDAFEVDDPRSVAKRLQKQKIVRHYQQKTQVFTLEQHSSGDCIYLHPKTRLCTIYEQRPDTCRNHPQIGPRPGFCAHVPQ